MDVDAYELEITVNAEKVEETQVLLCNEEYFKTLSPFIQAIADFKRNKSIVLYGESGRTIVLHYEEKTEEKITKKYSDLKNIAKTLIEITNRLKLNAINLKVVEGSE